MNKRRGHVCVLLSGGLDSAALVGHYLAKGRVVWPVYVAGGLRWENVERLWARRFLKALRSRRLMPLRVLPFSVRDLHPPGHWAISGSVPGGRAADAAFYLEGRNLLLLTKASVLCAQKGIGRISLAILGTNRFPDARPAFFRSLERSFRLGLGKTIRIETPFGGKTTKKDVVRRHAGLPLELTFSCIRPAGSRHCGRCGKCLERIRAFRAAGVPDPTPYR